MKALADRDRFRVGLVGLVVVALLAAAVVLLARASFGERSYTAVLEHTGGLRVGEEVQVAGVGVGEVTDVRLVDRHVEVRFTVDDDLRLGEDTTAEVKVATLLGTHFLLVSPAGAGELAGGRIPEARTSVPFNLQDVLDAGVGELDALDPVAVEAALTEVAATLEASGGELGPALDGVRRLSAHVAARSADLGELLEAAGTVSARLADSGPDLVALLRSADLVLDTLRARRATIHALLGDLATLGRELQGVVDDTADDLAPTLRDLQVVTDLLEEHRRDLGRSIRTLAPAGRYFANASGTGSWLDQFTPGATPDNLECHVERSCG